MTGLSAGTTYAFTVRANGSVGDSTASTPTASGPAPMLAVTGAKVTTVVLIGIALLLTGRFLTTAAGRAWFRR